MKKLKTLKGELDTVKGEIETLKKNNADNAALVKQIDDLKAAGKKRDEVDYAMNRTNIDGIVEKGLDKQQGKKHGCGKSTTGLVKSRA